MSKPEKTFSVGMCRAAVFFNEVKRDGQTITMPKVMFQIRYKDKDGQWKSTNSLGINDIPKAILVLQKVYEHLTAPKVRDADPEQIEP